MAASWTPTVSRNPSEPCGLVRRSWSSRAERAADASVGVMRLARSMKCSSVMSVPSQCFERFAQARKTGFIWYGDAGNAVETKTGAVAHDDTLWRERLPKAGRVDEQPVGVRGGDRESMLYKYRTQLFAH